VCAAQRQDDHRGYATLMIGWANDLIGRLKIPRRTADCYVSGATRQALSFSDPDGVWKAVT